MKLIDKKIERIKHKMFEPNWDDDQIDVLKRLWANGLTASKIAEKVGKTRNAVIGKARRLNLEARKSPIIRREIIDFPEQYEEEYQEDICAEPNCKNNIARGSYCEKHASIYYVQRDAKA